jgi:hypothetical protein
MIVCVLAQIRTSRFPNTSRKRDHLSHLIKIPNTAVHPTVKPGSTGCYFVIALLFLQNTFVHLQILCKGSGSY